MPKVRPSSPARHGDRPCAVRSLTCLKLSPRSPSPAAPPIKAERPKWAPAAQAAAPIVYGTADTTHTAVVALLNPDGGRLRPVLGDHRPGERRPRLRADRGALLLAGADDRHPQPRLQRGRAVHQQLQPAGAHVRGQRRLGQGGPGLRAHHDARLLHAHLQRAQRQPRRSPWPPETTGSAWSTTVEYVGFGVTTDATNNSNTLRNHASAPRSTSRSPPAPSRTTRAAGSAVPARARQRRARACSPPARRKSSQKVVGTTSYGSSKCQPRGQHRRRHARHLGDGPEAGSSSPTSAAARRARRPRRAARRRAPARRAAAPRPRAARPSTATSAAARAAPSTTCATGSTTITKKTCSSTTVCGWSAANNYYGCVAPPGGADPSGTYPLTLRRRQHLHVEQQQQQQHRQRQHQLVEQHLQQRQHHELRDHDGRPHLRRLHQHLVLRAGDGVRERQRVHPLPAGQPDPAPRTSPRPTSTTASTRAAWPRAARAASAPAAAAPAAALAPPPPGPARAPPRVRAPAPPPRAATAARAPPPPAATAAASSEPGRQRHHRRRQRDRDGDRRNNNASGGHGQPWQQQRLQRRRRNGQRPVGSRLARRDAARRRARALAPPARGAVRRTGVCSLSHPDEEGSPRI